ncbi:hypothetical protein ACLFKQ_30785, partial [Myxosarcina sp. GI1(2024)]
PKCQSARIIKYGSTHYGKLRFRGQVCRHSDGETTKLDHTLYAFHSFKTSKIKWQFIDSSSH